MLGCRGQHGPRCLPARTDTYDEMRPGCFDRVKRLGDMDLNHMIASVCFPSFPQFCGQRFSKGSDKQLALLCVQAFNDWIIEEWSGGSDGRLVPVNILPLWDVELAAAEARRCAERGSRAIAFSELPAQLNLPSVHDGDRYWDRLFSVCDEASASLCIHIGSSSQVPITSSDAPWPVSVALLANNTASSLVDFLWSGVLERFPNLKLVYAEGQLGWIPYILERCDKIWNHASPH